MIRNICDMDSPFVLDFDPKGVIQAMVDRKEFSYVSDIDEIRELVDMSHIGGL